MLPDLTTLLIVCPLVFLGGLVDSIAGGGGLISLTAYLVAGLPPHVALGTNKVSSALAPSLRRPALQKAASSKSNSQFPP